MIASMTGYFGQSGQIAHCYLIAAAPDLVEALEGCLNYLENTEAEFGVILSSADKARAALAKAKGEAA